MALAVPGVVPDATPDGGNTPSVNMSVPVDAFGGAVGHALSGLGEQVGRSADQLWARAVEIQNLQNETNAKNADAKYMQESGILHAAFLNKEGLNAGPDALAAHIKELQDLRTNIRSTLASPMAQKMYDASSVQFMGRNIFNAAGHSGQQMKVAANAATSSRIDELSDATGANPTDEEMFQRNTYGIHNEVAAQGARMGWTQDQIDETSKQYISQATAKRAAGLARIGKLDDAQHLLDQASKQGVLLPNDEAKVDAIVQTQRRAVGSANVATDVYNAGIGPDGQQTKSLKQLQDEAREKATAQYPDDPLYPQHAVQAVDQQYYVNRRAEQDERASNINQVESAILTLHQQNLPITRQALLADPTTAKAFLALPPQIQNRYDGKITEIANSDNFAKLWGMSKSTDDDVRADFMDRDLTKEQLDNSQRIRLMNRRADILKKAENEDSRLPRAMNWLRASMGGQMQDLSVDRLDRKDDQHSADYHWFVGTLDQALEQWQAETGKPATQEDVQKKIGPAIIEQHVAKGWFGNYTENRFTRPDPVKDEKFINTLKAEAAKNGQTLSDEQIRRGYVLSRIQQLYPAKTKDKFGGQ